jgi:hypothetical protein
MASALKLEVSPETIIRAVKGLEESARRAFMDDLIAATSPEYLQSIRDARRDRKTGRVKFHGDVFGR